MLGNLFRECGVVERLLKTSEDALLNMVTIFLGVSVGASMTAESFLKWETIGILLLGFIAFCIGTATGVIFGKIMAAYSHTPDQSPYRRRRRKRGSHGGPRGAEGGRR